MENIVKELCKFIIDNLYDDITLDKIEKEFYYSKYYLIRIFKICTGCTIKEFANTVKILKSVDPLIFTNDNILKIALNNGFNSQEYYSEKFLEIIGISPLKFRRKFRDLDSLNDVNELKYRKEYLLYLKQCQCQLLNISNTLEKNNKIKKITR